MIDKFFKETKWHPTLAKPVAGALLYTRYGYLVRVIMRKIAKKVGAATDTSRDYVYTDWVGLDKFVDDLVAQVRGAPQVRVCSGAGAMPRNTHASRSARNASARP